MRAFVTGLLLLLLAAVTLPLTAAAIEALFGDPRNLILPAHFLLMIALGIALVARGPSTARRLIVGAVAGAIAALAPAPARGRPRHPGGAMTCGTARPVVRGRVLLGYMDN